MAKNEQPAKISYFFGPGWSDLKKFITKLWKKNCESARNYHDKYRENGLMTLSGIRWLVCSISVVIYGTIFFAAVSILLSAFLSIFFVLVYIGFSVLWIIDRLYLKKNKIFTACPECKERSLIPVYACPSCGMKHTNLTPGKYGILHRTCNCGEKLGTCFLTGRKNYPSFCAHCGHSLSDRENMPICIPIVGGRSVGKTAFITAFSKEFVDVIAPQNDWTVEFYNNEKEQIYNEIVTDYNSGSTRMTDRPQDISKTSSVSFSFFLKGKEFKPERLLHVYDIAGEVFTDNSENEMQKQYEYCQGIVLIIDPFSIPAVKNRYESELQPADIAGIGKADISGIVDSFINKLREVTGLSTGKMSTTPVAVVISKVDAPGIQKEIGKEAVNALLEVMKEKNMMAEELDVEDYLCRKFLAEYGMESLLSGIDIKFKNNRYFACSSIGHTRDHGGYSPVGVMEPMEWIIKNTDSVMAKKLSTHKFGKVPLKMEV